MDDDAHARIATVAALSAARRTGVLEALLETADTPSAAADETDVDDRTASVLADVLADRGYFERVDGTYEPTNRALGLLTKTDLRSIGTTPHAIDRFEHLAALASTQDDHAHPPRDSDERANDERTSERRTSDERANDDRANDADTPRETNTHRNRLGAIQATPRTDVNAAVSAATRAAPTATRVLDLGGAPGPYATEFAARGHDVTLRDTPSTIAAARPLLEPRTLALDPGPLAPQAAADQFPPTDLVFASDLTPRLDDDALATTLDATHDALTAPTPENTTSRDHGARALVAIEHVREHSETAPTRRLDALAAGDPGDCRTKPELENALDDAGFHDVSLHAVPGLDRHAVVATPRST